MCVNDQSIKMSAIKHPQLVEICKAFMRCVGHFKSVSWHYAEYLALKYLVLFDPGKNKKKMCLKLFYFQFKQHL